MIASAALLASAVPAFADPSRSPPKQAEAQSVLGQIQQLDASLERAVEAYNLANDQAVRASRHDLRRTCASSDDRQGEPAGRRRQLSARLVTIYTSGEDELDARRPARRREPRRHAEPDRDRQQRLGAGLAGDRRGHAFPSARCSSGSELKHAQAEQAQVVAERAARKLRSSPSSPSASSCSTRSSGEIAQLQARGARAAGRLAAAGSASARQPQRSCTRRRSRRRHRRRGARAHAERRRAPGALRRRRRDRDAVPRHAVRLGRRLAGRLRLLRASSMYVFAQVGVSLPHNAAAQYSYGTPVSRRPARSPATSSSSTGSATSASTSAAASSSTRRTRATWSRSRR